MNPYNLAHRAQQRAKLRAGGGGASTLASLRNPETGKPEFNSGIALASEPPATSADKVRAKPCS